VNWVEGVPAGRIRVTAQIRHRHRPAAAFVEALDDPARAAVTFAEPQLAITPGQAVVLYEGDVGVGGGWID
jgi:tRNA-specific 2-thiouridylase